MKRTDIIFLLTSILIMSVAWVIFSIIHASTASTISSTVNQQIEPIAPAFDAKAMSSINRRQAIVPVYAIQNTIASDAAKVPPTPTPTLSPVPTISPTPSQTQGGKAQ